MAEWKGLILRWGEQPKGQSLSPLPSFWPLAFPSEGCWG